MIEIEQLIWDEWNKEHIARHQVTPQEVEEVCQGTPVVAQGYGGRLRLIGPTQSKRMLGVILAPKGEKSYYPVTARPASRKERNQYQEEGGEPL